MMPTKNGTHHSHPLGKPSRILVLGYYDGPTDGVIEFAGMVFRFTMPDEEQQLASESRTRDYLLQPLPADAIERVSAILEPHVAAKWPVWCPSWKFASPEIEADIDASVYAVLSEAGEAEWRLTTASVRFDDYHAARIPMIQESR